MDNWHNNKGSVNGIRQLRFIIFSLVGIIFIGCSREVQPDISTDKILALIGDRIITVEDFQRRAEYVPRPDYCRRDNNLHKKIILNSLIAEKLLALEAGEENDLMDNQFFTAFIQGRREQAMRQWHYYDMAFRTVKLDTLELAEKLRLTGLTYDVAYFTLPDTNLAYLVWDSLKQSMDFDEMYFMLSKADTLATRQVDWKDGTDPVLYAALFDTVVARGTIIPPQALDNGQVLFMKVLGWKERITMTETDTRQRWEDLVEREQLQQADRTYESYVGDLMRGKEVVFNESTFRELTKWAGDRYLRPREDKETAMNQALWKSDQEVNLEVDELSELPPAFSNQVLFTLDGRAWTVAEFKSLLQSHPLVYRKRKMGRGEFAEQFKLAIVDLIRDHFINQDAYSRDYDQVFAVRQNEALWQDHNLALFKREQVLDMWTLKDSFDDNFLQVVETRLNPYIDSLQTIYSSQIKINIDQFEQIELSRVDMFVTQKNVPYPIMVPDFPILTTDYRLDYGSILEE